MEVIHLHTTNGVYHIRATALSELCPLEDPYPRNDDAPPAEAVGEAKICREHEDCPTYPQKTSEWHTRLAICHSDCVKGLARLGPSQ